MDPTLAGAASMSPWGMIGGAALSGLGAYFGSDAEAQAMQQQAKIQQEQIDLKAKEDAQAQAAKVSASGIVGSGIPTGAYGQTLNYTDPNAAATNSTIQTFLSGGLTDAEKAQMGIDIKTGTQSINAAAATSGMPAGARMGVQGQNVAQIGQNYANTASARIGTGLTAANNAANTGLNIANQNYQSGLNNYLNQQNQQNMKTQLLAGYAT